MNRIDFQQLAELRIDEAGVLLTHKKYDGAYYLAGYAVECGLKACISRLTYQDDYPDKQFAQDCYTHVIEKLVGLARLKAQRDADAASNPQFEAHWLIVKDWNGSSRYERKSMADAQTLYNAIVAIVDPADGALPWIRRRW